MSPLANQFSGRLSIPQAEAAGFKEPLKQTHLSATQLELLNDRCHALRNKMTAMGLKIEFRAL